MKARHNLKDHYIAFDRRWLMSLSAKAWCATLVHELWHSVAWERAIRARRSYLLNLILGSLLITMVFFGAIDALIFAFTRRYFAVSELVFLVLVFWLLVILLRQQGLLKKYSWPLEFESDEVSVKFIGREAKKEVIESLRTRWATFTNPPASLRLKHVDEVAANYPTHIIDFGKLESEVKQVFVQDGGAPTRPVRRENTSWVQCQKFLRVQCQKFLRVQCQKFLRVRPVIFQ